MVGSGYGAVVSTTEGLAVMHSLAWLASVDDLACFVEVLRRDGRIMVGGYEVVRFTRDRWDLRLTARRLEAGG